MAAAAIACDHQKGPAGLLAGEATTFTWAPAMGRPVVRLAAETSTRSLERLTRSPRSVTNRMAPRRSGPAEARSR